MRGTLKLALACFAVAFLACLVMQLSCGTVMAQEIDPDECVLMTCPQPPPCPSPCLPCVCEETDLTDVVMRLDAIEAALVCPQETAPAVTEPAVKEGVRPGGMDGSMAVFDDVGLRMGAQSWPSRHPVWTSILVGLGFTAVDAVAHHNEWFWYDHDDGDRGPRGRRGPAGEQGPAGKDGEDGEDGTCWPPGKCK